MNERTVREGMESTWKESRGGKEDRKEERRKESDDPDFDLSH